MTYSAELSKKLEKLGITEGCKITVKNGEKTQTGVLMPHHDFSASDILIMKMKSGYNIGVRVSKDTKIEKISDPVERKKVDVKVEEKKGLPTLALIGTGGTIASYVDYRTGAVHPALSTSDIINAVPEVREIANVRANVLFSIYSENMDQEHWEKLAKAVADEIENGADGVIIPHGTDTMGYTAAALSFMLKDVPVPVILVGAQRSSDRPSSDASTNLMACARFCTLSKKSGVFVIMHDTHGDDSFSVHLGTRVRKMHTSRRDAFESLNIQPFANIDKDGKIKFNFEIPSAKKKKMELKPKMDKNTVLLQFYPGMDASLFKDVITKSKGVVIAGSGLGHVNDQLIPVIKKAIDNGTVVVMTSQCLNGQTNMNVYNTGRDLITAGVISVLDMLPETAYIKLSWALANCKDVDEVKKIMMTPLVNEMSERRTF